MLTINKQLTYTLHNVAVLYLVLLRILICASLQWWTQFSISVTSPWLFAGHDLFTIHLRLMSRFSQSREPVIVGHMTVCAECK